MRATTRSLPIVRNALSAHPPLTKRDGGKSLRNRNKSVSESPLRIRIRWHPRPAAIVNEISVDEIQPVTTPFRHRKTIGPETQRDRLFLRQRFCAADIALNAALANPLRIRKLLRKRHRISPTWTMLQRTSTRNGNELHPGIEMHRLRRTRTTGAYEVTQMKKEATQEDAG
jgi:hypothetical protein